MEVLVNSECGSRVMGLQGEPDLSRISACLLGAQIRRGLIEVREMGRD